MCVLYGELLQREPAGNVYHETLRPPPRGGDNSFVVVEALPGDGNRAAVSSRLEAYRLRCDGVVQTFAAMGGAEEEREAYNGEDKGESRGSDPAGKDGQTETEVFLMGMMESLLREWVLNGRV